MTLTLELTLEQEIRLQERARASGVAPAEYLLHLLDNAQEFAEGPRPGESLLDGLKRIGVVGAFKSSPRVYGRPWSEIEGYEFE